MTERFTRPTPLFLLSMPRSGSTMLQRLLAAHAEVSTSPEPTFLLPLLHIDRSTDVVATFDQRYTSWAVQDFVSSLPRGRIDYEHSVAEFARDLYTAAADVGARYHVDKTPKYHLVANDIAELFPEAPIIVLWRNPLAVIASILTTWGRGGGRWNLADFRVDLFEGLPNLIELTTNAPDRVVQVRYEDLIDDATATLSSLLGRLDLPYDASVLHRFQDVSLEGRVQDHNVTKEGFGTVRSDRVDRWKTVLGNPIRRRWSRRYLRWLGNDRLHAMGYELQDLLDELDRLPPTTKFLATDLLDVPFDVLSRTFETQLAVYKLRQRRAGRRLTAHK